MLKSGKINTNTFMLSKVRISFFFSQYEQCIRYMWWLLSMQNLKWYLLTFSIKIEKIVRLGGNMKTDRSFLGSLVLIWLVHLHSEKETCKHLTHFSCHCLTSNTKSKFFGYHENLVSWNLGLHLSSLCTNLYSDYFILLMLQVNVFIYTGVVQLGDQNTVDRIV